MLRALFCLSALSLTLASCATDEPAPGDSDTSVDAESGADSGAESDADIHGSAPDDVDTSDAPDTDIPDSDIPNSREDVEAGGDAESPEDADAVEVTDAAQDADTVDDTDTVEDTDAAQDADADSDSALACDEGTVELGGECVPAPAPGFVWIPAGGFIMGAPPEELGNFSNEIQHPVTLSQRIEMLATPVTQSLWVELMGNNPSTFVFEDFDDMDCAQLTCNPDGPVENIAWWDALSFANALSVRAGFAECYALQGCTGVAGDDLDCEGVEVLSARNGVYGCEGYRLPTEAEWEYAARAGTTTAVWVGDHSREERLGAVEPVLEPIAWYAHNSMGRPQQVAQKLPNPWGLYDMIGNVFEWTQDWYAGRLEPDAVTDPLGAEEGQFRILRGGSWGRAPNYARAATRAMNVEPANRFSDFGFRVVRSVPD